MSHDCIFCKIARGEVPSLKIYEDDFTLVFMDIANDVEGHLLAIPKKHVKNVFDCDRETLYHLADTVKTVAEHLVSDCGYTGVNLLNANDESAGQTVLHFHIHIIPRKEKDGVDAWPHFKGAKCDLEEIYKELSKKTLKSGDFIKNGGSF